LLFNKANAFYDQQFNNKEPIVKLNFAGDENV